MSEPERGAYTPPTDAPLAFESRQPVRGTRPFPLTLVVSLLVLAGLAVAIFVFYRSGVRNGPATPQDLGQPVGPLKEAAPADQQPQDAAAGLQIYRSENGQPAPSAQTPPNFTPQPEQPQPRPTASTSPVPAAAPTTPVTAGPALRPAQPAPSPSAAPPPVSKPVEVARAEPPPKPVVKAPPEKPVEKPAAKAAPEKPVAARKAEPTPAPAAKGGAVVQIGAVSSPQLADKTWNEAVAAAPGLAAGKGKGVEKVEKDGKTLYRTSVTGFATRAEAQAFCGKLKAAGKACFVK